MDRLKIQKSALLQLSHRRDLSVSRASNFRRTSPKIGQKVAQAIKNGKVLCGGGGGGGWNQTLLLLLTGPLVVVAVVPPLGFNDSRGRE